MPPKPKRVVTPAFYVFARFPQDPRLLGSQEHVQGILVRILSDLRCLLNVVTTIKGADDDVTDPSTGTDKGNPTVSAIFAIPADSDSDSGDSARNPHPCGCRHSC